MKHTKDSQSRLILELAKLDRTEERGLAEEALMADESWPEY